jgi:hypothetical protein
MTASSAGYWGRTRPWTSSLSSGRPYRSPPWRTPPRRAVHRCRRARAIRGVPRPARLRVSLAIPARRRSNASTAGTTTGDARRLRPVCCRQVAASSFKSRRLPGVERTRQHAPSRSHPAWLLKWLRTPVCAKVHPCSAIIAKAFAGVVRRRLRAPGPAWIAPTEERLAQRSGRSQATAASPMDRSANTGFLARLGRTWVLR